MKFARLLKAALAVALWGAIGALLSDPAHASFTYVQTFPDSAVVRSTAGTSGKETATVPSGGIATGSLVVVVVYYASYDTGTPSDSRSNAYTTASKSTSTSGSVGVLISYSVVTTALLAGDTITIQGQNTPSTGNPQGMTVLVFTPSAAPQIDTTAQYQSSATAAAGTFTTPTITTAQSQELLIAGTAAIASSAVSLTAGSGYTLSDTPTTISNIYAITQYKTAASAGANTASFTTSGSTTSQAIALAAFSVTGGGSGGTATTVRRMKSIIY